MILLADSGSTKCDWAIISDDKNIIARFETTGLNPNYVDAAFIRATVGSTKELYPYFSTIQEVFFYGAGCGSSKSRSIVKEGLSAVFSQSNILIDHDVNASAYALYQNEPVVACILGTGSNACLYDGNKVIEGLPSLGFILADEGSGNYFGKELIRAYFYKQLPEALALALENEYHLNYEDFIHQVYHEPRPNKYLASFMPFYSKHRDGAWIQNTLSKGFTSFLHNHVKPLNQNMAYEVGFVGSVALHFEEELHAACNHANIKVGKILKKPMDGLIAYHQ